uniref:Gustatory receptor n=1 Tax=Anopheles albimanus TaxID=7167 RepID=A0A182G071_ANOAL
MLPGADETVLFVHLLLGGPIWRDEIQTGLTIRPLLTVVSSSISIILFAFVLVDLRTILYSQDLVLGVIELLMLFGFASTLFALHVTAIAKYLHNPRKTFFRSLTDIDGHLYALDRHRQPAKGVSHQCLMVLVSSIAALIFYMLANYYRLDKGNAVVLAFKAYALFTIVLASGLFLVLCRQLRLRIKCIVAHLHKIINPAQKGGISKGSILRLTHKAPAMLLRDFRSLAIVQTECFRAADSLNKDCAMMNLSLFALVFYILTSKSFQLFYVSSKQLAKTNHGFSFTEFLEPVVLLMYSFVYLAIATYFGETLIREMQLVVNNLHQFESTQAKPLLYQLDRANDQIEQLGHQIFHQPVALTVDNFFQIDLKFFHLASIMASVGTYLIILLQFDFNN